MIERLLGLLLLFSPFLIGISIFILLSPVGFWQNAVTFIVAFLICFFEGIFAWVIGLALLLHR